MLKDTNDLNWHQFTERVNFSGNVIIMNYLKHHFLHFNLEKGVFISVYLGRHVP